MFTGTYQRSLDEKNRFAIPKRLRDSLSTPNESRLFIGPGTDGSLAVYTEAALARLGEQLNSGSPTAQDVRAFSRLFYAQVECLEMDKQGRVRVPTELVTAAELGKEIVLIGVRDHMEIWGQAAWQEYFGLQQPRYDEIAEGAFDGVTKPAVSANDAEMLARTLPPR